MNLKPTSLHRLRPLYLNNIKDIQKLIKNSTGLATRNFKPEIKKSNKENNLSSVNSKQTEEKHINSTNLVGFIHDFIEAKEKDSAGDESAQQNEEIQAYTAKHNFDELCFASTKRNAGVLTCW